MNLRAILATSTALLLACVTWGAARHASVAPQDGAALSADQNWTAEQRDEFWFTNQGSRLLPYDWFLALTGADGAPFRSDASLGGFGYLPAAPSPRNPDGLPIGFVKDVDPDTGRGFLGLSCAACHTNRIEIGSRAIIVDGAPTLADFGRFREALASAVVRTAEDDVVFARFAEALGREPRGRAELRAELSTWSAMLRADLEANRPTHPAGPGRLDAFGEIYNAVTAKWLGQPENVRPPDAPVSYPAIWDAPQHDCVQWNGSAANAGIGHLVRNTGEVLGVFGTLEFQPPGSSAHVAALLRLESLLATLWSPEWPSDVLGPVTGDVVRGGEVYARSCEGCHPSIRRDDPSRRIEARLVEVQTDPAMHAGFFRPARPGPLAGRGLPGDEPLAEDDRAVRLVAFAVVSVLAGRQPEIPGFAEGVERFKQAREACEPKADRVRYKARPLNGIWATAPYLHNGSVPSLRALLDPAEERPESFLVGSHVFDPENVGFCSAAPCEGWRFDATLPGSENVGHAFGTQLPAEDKAALIAYLKTL